MLKPGVFTVEIRHISTGYGLKISMDQLIFYINNSQGICKNRAILNGAENDNSTKAGMQLNNYKQS